MGIVFGVWEVFIDALLVLMRLSHFLLRGAFSDIGLREVVTAWWSIGVVLWGLILLAPKVRIILLPVLESILLFLSILHFVFVGVLSLIMIPAVLVIGSVLFLLYRSGRSKNHDKRFSNGDNIYVWGVWAIWFFGVCLFFVVVPSLGPGLWYPTSVDPLFAPCGPFLSIAALLTLRMIWYGHKETATRRRNLLPLGGLSIGLILTLWLLVVYADDTLQLQLTNVCYQCDLSGADLSNRDLSGADLRGANLAGANLTGARLDGARLDWSVKRHDWNYRRLTSLAGATLTGASLVGANLERADLAGANFTDADLIKANLRGTRAINVNFTNANLKHAKGACGWFQNDTSPRCGSNRYCNTTMTNGVVQNSECPLSSVRSKKRMKGWRNRLDQSQRVNRTQILAVSSRHIRDALKIWCVSGTRNTLTATRLYQFECTGLVFPTKDQALGEYRRRQSFIWCGASRKRLWMAPESCRGSIFLPDDRIDVTTLTPSPHRPNTFWCSSGRGVGQESLSLCRNIGGMSFFRIARR